MTRQGNQTSDGDRIIPSWSYVSTVSQDGRQCIAGLGTGSVLSGKDLTSDVEVYSLRRDSSLGKTQVLYPIF